MHQTIRQVPPLELLIALHFQRLFFCCFGRTKDLTAELAARIEFLAILKPPQNMAANAPARYITNMNINMKPNNINVEPPNNKDNTGITLLRAL